MIIKKLYLNSKNIYIYIFITEIVASLLCSEKFREIIELKILFLTEPKRKFNRFYIIILLIIFLKFEKCLFLNRFDPINNYS